MLQHGWRAGPMQVIWSLKDSVTGLRKQIRSRIRCVFCLFRLALVCSFLFLPTLVCLFGIELFVLCHCQFEEGNLFLIYRNSY